MKKKSIVMGLLFGAGLTSAAIAATTSYTTGDVIVGFRADPGVTDNNLSVDLGSAANYFGLSAGSIVDLSSRVTTADLQAAFGSGFGSLGGSLTFEEYASNSKSVASVGQPKQTIWLGQMRPDALSQTAPISTSSGASQGIAAGEMEKSYFKNSQFPAAFAPQTSTTNSNFAVIVSGGAAGSYNGQAMSSNGYLGTQFNASDLEQTATASANTGGTWALSDFYLLNPSANNGPGTYLGTFGLNLTTGVFKFEAGGADAFASAVPEPSTYALLIGAGALGFVALRRRKVALAA